LIVVDLEAARTALAAAGARVIDDDYTEDPFGDQIELIDAGDAGFTNRR